MIRLADGSEWDEAELEQLARIFFAIAPAEDEEYVEGEICIDCAGNGCRDCNWTGETWR